VPGGSEVPVTLANRLRYVEAALRFRLHEFDPQIAAIRRGLANLVPIASLALFTWQEVEVLVAGSPVIDPAYLRKYTVYEGGYNAEHPVIKSFWRVFEAFSDEQRCNFVR
jgi:E3 ubiquitin-protein ligase HERC2